MFWIGLINDQTLLTQRVVELDVACLYACASRTKRRHRHAIICTLTNLPTYMNSDKHAQVHTRSELTQMHKLGGALCSEPFQVIRLVALTGVFAVSRSVVYGSQPMW